MMALALAAGIFFAWLLLVLGTMGAAVGAGLRWGARPITATLIGAAVFLAWFLFTVLGMQMPNGQSWWSTWQLEFERSWEMSRPIYEQMGWNATEIARAAAWLKRLFIDGAIGWLVLIALGLGYASMNLQRRLLPRSAGAKIPLRPFPAWTMPEPVIWLLIVSLILWQFGGRWDARADWIGWNGMIVLANLYFLVGLAVVFHYFQQWKVPPALRMLMILFIGLMPALILAVTGIGIMDTWWNWRRFPPMAKLMAGGS